MNFTSKFKLFTLLSKNTIKFYSQLQQKKYRKFYKLFLAEGEKTIKEFLKENFEVEIILISDNKYLLEDNYKKFQDKVEKVSEETIKKISSFKSPQEIIAVFKIPEYIINFSEIEKELNIVLDNIKDPGNMGTIIRIADWFGIKNIICSDESVDTFNPKVVQASMGSLARVKVHHSDINHILEKTNKKIYGTYLEGENIFTSNLENSGYILMGNESKGIRKDFNKYVTNKLFIPPFSALNETVDSLNISIATGIVCAEFRRRNYSK